MPTMVSVPNQRIVHIHREKPTKNFLGIKNENWQAASRDLGAYGLQLYLYFASNSDNYEIALSPAALENAIGIHRSTYQDHFLDLVRKGYLIVREPKTPGATQSNIYDFYEVPHKGLQQPIDGNCGKPIAVLTEPPDVQSRTPGDIEINNNTPQIEINKGNALQEEKKCFKF